MTITLRPLERRVLDLRASGVSDDEIAWRFRRSPGFVRRVVRFSEMPDRSATTRQGDGLRPLERVVRKNRERGLSTPEIAARLRRSPRSIQQIEAIAAYRLAQ